ncbi:MAG TPA: hypothetical protein VD735_01630 [Candidatus Saccharimonadales bacterium]|nr:hypothetical protein [Candidatus Saccharimonadales bacterium]
MYRFRYENGQPVAIPADEPIEAVPAPIQAAEAAPVTARPRMKNIGGCLIAVTADGEPLVGVSSPAEESPLATTTPSPSESKPENMESRVRRIVDSITGRGLRGKFPSGISMNTNSTLDALVVDHNIWSDYTAYGDHTDVQSRLSSLHSLFTDMSRKEGQSPHYLYMAPYEDGEHHGQDAQQTVVNYAFETDFRDRHNRPARYVSATFVMPATSANTLRDMVSDNADAAEMFFQQAANGLEASGVGRVQSDRVIMVDGIKFEHPLNSRVYANGAQLRRDYQKTEPVELQYSQPYGNVAVAPGR